MQSVDEDLKIRSMVPLAWWRALCMGVELNIFERRSSQKNHIDQRGTAARVLTFQKDQPVSSFPSKLVTTHY